jgi:hypothetical protein
MKGKLPVAIVIPHSGLAIPPELTGRIALSPAQIFNEADAYANGVYGFPERVLHWVSFPYARAVLDINRPLDPALNRPGDSINVPFYGGWNVQRHSHDRQPWCMIEINRALYIGHAPLALHAYKSIPG